MARAHPRVKVEDQAAYGVAQKQLSSYSAPDTALQQYRHPNGVNCSEPNGHIPRQFQFPGHEENASDAVRAQNIERSMLDASLPDASPLHPEARNRRANRTCDMCKRLFDSEASLFDHLRYQHENTVCRSCDRVFRDSDEWHKHIISRTPIKVRASVCAICEPSIAFDMEKNYNDHMWHFHNKCKPCGLNFDNKQDRLVHGAVVHHRCPDCFQFLMCPNDLCKHYKGFHGINPLTMAKPTLPTVPAVPVKKEFPTVTPPTAPPISTAVTQVKSEEVKPCVKTQGRRIKCATAQASVVFETYPPRSAVAKATPKKKKKIGTSQSLITSFFGSKA
ncbi:zinc finger BTB domain-containing protein [Fusarium napiforme]|uniref:Zinc finger BTB domain-containing protein n=1 Tax=Fusarium napiforme TaxID=42672 RepID=A0A8H5NEM3_9HYPO|nr:zinc finger BTB domain-containing protein [Fusarium napiforme]